MSKALLGPEIVDAAPIHVGEAWEVNGCLWRVVKIVKRGRIVLKCEGAVQSKKPVVPWWKRLFSKGRK